MKPRQADLDEFREWLSRWSEREIPEAHIEVREEPLVTFQAERHSLTPPSIHASGNLPYRYSWDDVTVQDFGDYRLLYDGRKWGRGVAQGKP